MSREMVPLGYLLAGSVMPEGAITATPGAIYWRLADGKAVALYVKETGVHNTGWAAK